jgi:hypothetical protein
MFSAEAGGESLRLGHFAGPLSPEVPILGYCKRGRLESASLSSLTPQQRTTSKLNPSIPLLQGL